MKAALGLALLVALSAPGRAAAPIPRQSPEFTITDSSGRQTLLSAFRGKVVMLEFLLMNCPHCQRIAQTIERLNHELGPSGFQPLGVAFNPNISGRVMTEFASWLRLTFPIGQSSSDVVDAYLGRTPVERLMVPQIVIIDRQGVIRAQSGPKGDPNPDDEARLRAVIQGLLHEEPGRK